MCSCFTEIPRCQYAHVPWYRLCQVEERLRFYDGGLKPRKNVEVMTEAATLAREQAGGGGDAQQQVEADDGAGTT